MKRTSHIFALLLFALTQFVAPFAHAHVDGTQDNTSIHTSDIPHHLPYSGFSHCHIESHESQAIDLQQEYQRDDAAAIPVTPVSALQSFASTTTIFVSNDYDPPHSVTFAYHRPHPQAPPA
ncbi:MAG: hypothetical protein HY799_09460 [Nitrosomonadales bacterium]|nr:hypothetical protein [Nitrosomonadales bacterium]